MSLHCVFARLKQDTLFCMEKSHIAVYLKGHGPCFSGDPIHGNLQTPLRLSSDEPAPVLQSKERDALGGDAHCVLPWG